MNLIYLFLMVLGLCTAIAGVLRQQSLQRQKRILDPQVAEAETKIVSTIDYKSLIVANSLWLILLDKLDKDLRLKMLIFSLLAGIIILLNVIGGGSLSGQSLGLLLTVMMCITIVLPGLLISPAVKSGTKKMMDALPYMVDLVAVCVQSGMTVESALKFVSHRFHHLDANLACLIAQVVKKAEVSGMEEALAELYHSLDMTEIRMFTATLQQSVHYGTSLYDNLIELSQDIRELQLLITEEKIGSLSAKMSVPLIIFIMFPITILIAAPGILRILKNGIF